MFVLPFLSFSRRQTKQKISHHDACLVGGAAFRTIAATVQYSTHRVHTHAHTLEYAQPLHFSPGVSEAIVGQPFYCDALLLLT